MYYLRLLAPPRPHPPNATTAQAWALQLVEASVNAAASVEAAAHAAAAGNGGGDPTGWAGPSVTLPAVFAALDAAGAHPYGMVALSQGYLLTSIVLASAMCHITDRRFEKVTPLC